MTFKVGDLVRLKSGSPKLTVVATNSAYDDVTVTWIAYGTGVSHTYTGPSAVFVLSRD